MSKKTVTLASLTALGAAKAAQATKSHTPHGDAIDAAMTVLTAQTETPAVLQSLVEPTTETETPVVEATDKVNDKKLVKLRMPEGTYEHGAKMASGEPKWIRTPMFKGRERWFDRTKIHNWGKDDDGLYAIVTYKEAVQRDMQAFIVKDAVVE
jgi:hypothetical protein